MTPDLLSADCPSCAAALADPLSGAYHSDCRECQARALSHSPVYWASMLARKFRGDYAEALRRIAGGGATEREALHRRVKWWAEHLAEARAARTEAQTAAVWGAA
jgi:hypothetical protein